MIIERRGVWRVYGQRYRHPQYGWVGLKDGTIVAPNGIIWGPGHMAPYQSLVKVLRENGNGTFAYKLACGDTLVAYPVDGRHPPRRRCHKCKSRLDATWKRAQK